MRFNLSKLKIRVIILLTAFSVFSFMVGTAFAYEAIPLWPNQHTAYSSSEYFNSGDTIIFGASSDESSIHNVALVLFDSSGNALDTKIVVPGYTSGNTYNVSTAGYYYVGLGCGGNGQTGCTASGYIDDFHS